jgi:hypothetical protein
MTVEQLLSEAFDDDLFYDSSNEDGTVSEGSCTINGELYKWRFTLDDVWRVRISYKIGPGEWHENCLIDDADPKLVEYLRRMATAVGIIRSAQNEPRSPYHFDSERGWHER